MTVDEHISIIESKLKDLKETMDDDMFYDLHDATERKQYQESKKYFEDILNKLKELKAYENLFKRLENYR